MQTTSASWPHVHWVVLCLCLLAAACTSAPSAPSITPAARGPAQTPTITAYRGHTSTVYAVAWSPDGTRIASGGNDSTVQVWDAKGGHRLLTYTGHTAPVREVTWSPDGTRLASASQDGTIQVWDANSGRHLLTYHGQTAPLWALTWSPSGTCIASATGNTSDEQQRESVQVWNATNGQLLTSYPIPSSAGYASGTLSVAWSPDGTRLASGGADTIIHLWKAPATCRR